MRKYIQEVPPFDVLADLREEIKSLLSALSGLAGLSEGRDGDCVRIIDSATDLCSIADDVRKSVYDLCTELDEDEAADED